MAKTAPAWHPKMARFMKAIESRGANLADSIIKADLQMQYINTGSSVLNLLIGGSKLPDGKFVCPGWPKGKISEVYGRESSGKSTIALMGMAQACALKDGTGTGLYVDLEHAVVDAYALKLGVDFRSPATGGTGQVMRVAPLYAEDVEAIVAIAAVQGMDFIVIDSVAALVTRDEFKRNTADERQKKHLADIPRFMANWLPKLQSVIAKTGTHVMFLNQTRDKIGAMGFTEEALKSTTGGNALKFYASNRIMLKPKSVAKAKRFNPLLGKEEEVPIATDIEVKNIKNKVDSKQGYTGIVTLRYGVGIDEIRTMINVASAYDIVQVRKKGKKVEAPEEDPKDKRKAAEKAANEAKTAMYSFTTSSGRTLECLGLEKFRFALSKDDEAFRELSVQCHERMMDHMRGMSDGELAELEEGAVRTHVGDNDEDDYDQGEDPKTLSPEEMGEEPDEKPLSAGDLLDA